MQYSAPEILRRDQYIGPASDIWSLGVVLYTLIHGSLPFGNETSTVAETYTAASKKNFYVDLTVTPGKERGGFNVIASSYVPSDCVDLLMSMLDPDPDERITLQQIREHPWTNKGKIYAHNLLWVCMLSFRVLAHLKDTMDPRNVFSLSMSPSKVSQIRM